MIKLETETIIPATKIIGIGLMVFGTFWAIFDRYLCRFLCKTCSSLQLSPCFFLFLFVGIIFVVAGFSLTGIQKISLSKIRLKDKEKI